MTETREQVLALAERVEADTVRRKTGRGFGPGMSLETIRSGEIVARALRLLAETMGREAEPVTCGPYRVKWMGPGVWAGIPVELPPELEGRDVWLSTTPPAPGYADGRRDGLEDAAIEWRNARTVVCRKLASASHEELARLDAAATALAHEIAIGPIARRRALNKDSTDE